MYVNQKLLPKNIKTEIIKKGQGCKSQSEKGLFFLTKTRMLMHCFHTKEDLVKLYFTTQSFCFKRLDILEYSLNFQGVYVQIPADYYFFLVYNIFLISGKFRQDTSMRTQMCELDVSQSNHVFAYNI